MEAVEHRSSGDGLVSDGWPDAFCRHRWRTQEEHILAWRMSCRWPGRNLFLWTEGLKLPIEVLQRLRVREVAAWVRRGPVRLLADS